MKVGTCPSCSSDGVVMADLSDRLRACMNLDCRVNEFEIEYE